MLNCGAHTALELGFGATAAPGTGWYVAGLLVGLVAPGTGLYVGLVAPDTGLYVGIMTGRRSA